MIFCNICSYSILVNIRLLFWFLETRLYECCHSCFLFFCNHLHIIFRNLYKMDMDLRRYGRINPVELNEAIQFIVSFIEYQNYVTYKIIYSSTNFICIALKETLFFVEIYKDRLLIFHGIKNWVTLASLKDIWLKFNNSLPN